jgi:hypothetical protein
MPVELKEDIAFQGTAYAIFLFDVCEEIRLELLRGLLDAQRLQPAFKHAAPEYVRFERPPVVEPLEPLVLDSGERLEGEIKYYDYGVVSVVLHRPFFGSSKSLVQLSGNWISGTGFEQHARRVAEQKVARAATAMSKPYETWLDEDYYTFNVTSLDNISGQDVLSRYGTEIAQIVRGETSVLSPGENSEVLQSSISYYRDDLAVIGWNAAFIYDTPAGAAANIQLLEYANSQLLEFRHYDEYLTRELAGVYRALEDGTGVMVRWRLARTASKLHAVTLDVTELTERVDNAIKFLSDMYSARLYRLAASKIGVPDYQGLVGEKLQTARDLYGFLIDQFQQSRAFVLELMVVIILVIELVYVFRGK